MTKTILEGYVTTSDHITFTVQGAEKEEGTILVVFSNATQYNVVKLDVKDLPASDGGKNITWINNFGITDSSGNYVGNVDYTVFLPAKTNATFVYKDANGLKSDKTPKVKGSKPEHPGMVQVDFSTGDPGIGWK